MLLGRVTHQEWSQLWPMSKDEPFATFITTPKYVVSTTLDGATRQNSMLIKGDLADRIAALKQQPGKDIGVQGSPSLVRSLLRLGLLDELRLAIPPVIAGTGQRLFDDNDHTRRLQLAASSQTSTGVMLLTYRARST